MKVDDTLVTPEQFGEIPLRIRADGGAIRLRDVARVEFGQSEYGFVSRVNQMTATGLAVKMAPGSNAVATAKRIRATLDELSRYFPEGVSYNIPYDTSAFVEISIRKVVSTLLEAMLLVFAVMYLFMQNFRATLIPTLVVPVALLGTFTVMLGLGFSINVLTMFGMVLAIGILVDDAIIVVENVERLMAEEGLSPHDATVKAMRQISRAIVGITVVLVSVFVPMAFFSGAVGNIYRQFAVTLAVSIGFSAFLALSLTPALCATLLRPIDADHHEKRGFFGWFNRAFLRLTGRYRNAVAGILARPVRWMLVYALVIGVVALLFVRLPQAFLPEEDQGDFMIMVMQPEGTPMAETMANVADVERYLAEHEPVAYAYAVGGFSLYGDGTSSAMIFATLKDWSERREASQHVGAIVERINQRFAGLPNRTVYAMNSPPLPDLGSTSGFDFRLQDRGGVGYEALVKARDQLLARAAEDPRLANVMFAGQGEAPQIRLDIDRRKAETLGVSMDEINTTLAVMFGSDYIGDFMHGSQVRKVVVQADGAKRLGIDDIGRLHVRNEQGEMVPLATFAKAAWTLGATTDPLQRLSLVQPRGPGRAGLQQRRSHAGDGAIDAGPARGHRPRVVRPVLRRTPVRRPGAGAVRPLGVDRVPRPGRPLRKLVDPAGGDPGGAAGRTRRTARGEPARSAQRHLLQGRPDHHHRPLGEERHPHHRGGQGPLPGRHEPAAGDPGGRAPALATDRHDLAGVRFRRGPAGALQRRRFRRPGRHRHRGARRDRHRHGTRGVPGTAVLPGGRAPVPVAQGAAHRQLAPDPHGASLMPLAKLSLPTLALCVGLLGACSPTPRQPRAAPIVPANGPDLRGKLDDWQQQFTDPLLRQMIGYAPALSGAQA